METFTVRICKTNGDNERLITVSPKSGAHTSVVSPRLRVEVSGLDA